MRLAAAGLLMSADARPTLPVMPLLWWRQLLQRQAACAKWLKHNSSGFGPMPSGLLNKTFHSTKHRPQGSFLAVSWPVYGHDAASFCCWVMSAAACNQLLQTKEMPSESTSVYKGKQWCERSLQNCIQIMRFVHGWPSVLSDGLR